MIRTPSLSIRVFEGKPRASGDDPSLIHEHDDIQA